MKIKVIGCSGADLPGHNTSAFLLNDEILFDAGSLGNVLDEKAQLKAHLFNSALWPDFTTIPCRDDGILHLVELKPAESLVINDFTVTPFKVNHTVPAQQ